MNQIGNPVLNAEESRAAQFVKEKIEADERPAKIKEACNHITNAVEDCLELMQFAEMPKMESLIIY